MLQEQENGDSSYRFNWYEDYEQGRLDEKQEEGKQQEGLDKSSYSQDCKEGLKIIERLVERYERANKRIKKVIGDAG